MDNLVAVVIIGFALVLVMLYGINQAIEAVAERLQEFMPLPGKLPTAADLKTIEEQLESSEKSMERGLKDIWFQLRDIEQGITKILDHIQVSN